MGTLTVAVRRLVLVIAAVVLALVAGAGVSAAQDRPDAPPLQPSPNLNLNKQDEANQGNDFQQDYAKCEDGDTGGLVGTLVDSALRALGPGTQVLTMTDNPLRCTLKAGAANPVDAAATGLENAASAFWGDPVGKLAKAVMEGNVSAFAMVMTFWMSVPIPGLSGAAGMNGIRNITFELQFVFLAFGIVFAAIKLAIARKQAVLDGAEETARMITRTIFAVTLLPLLVLTLHAIGDSFSSFVIEKAAGEGSGTINGIAWIDEETGLGPVVSLLFAGLALLGSVVQLIALIVREAILTLAVALAPMAAAISVTNSGRMSWNSIMTFTAGALLFKPVASLIYVFAFWAAQSEDVASAIVGAVLLAVAGLALPSIIRIVAPAAESISGSGAQMAGLAAATGAMAGSLASRGGSGASGAGGGAGASGSAASGSSSYGGQYTGGGSPGGGGGGRAANAASPNGSSPARAGGSRATAAGAGAKKVAGLAGGAIGGAAKAMQAAGAGVSAASNIAEGSIGNYHGRIQR